MQEQIHEEDGGWRKQGAPRVIRMFTAAVPLRRAMSCSSWFGVLMQSLFCNQGVFGLDQGGYSREQNLNQTTRNHENKRDKIGRSFPEDTRRIAVHGS